MRYKVLKNFVDQKMMDEVRRRAEELDTTVILPETYGNAVLKWKYVRSVEETANGNPGMFATLPLFDELFDLTAKAINTVFGTENSDIHRVDSYFRVSKYTTPQCIPRHVDIPGNCNFTWLFEMNDDFEGGEFVLDGEVIKMNKGDMLIFNNELIHEVLPITKGVRWAAFTKFRIIQ